MLRKTTIVKMTLLFSMGVWAFSGTLSTRNSYALPHASATSTMAGCPGKSDDDLLKDVMKGLSIAFPLSAETKGEFFRGNNGRIKLRVICKAGTVTLHGFARRASIMVPVDSAKNQVIAIATAANCSTPPDSSRLGVKKSPGCGTDEEECNGGCIPKGGSCPFGN